MTPEPLTLQTVFALDVFILDAQARNLSPRTIRYYRQQLGWLAKYLALRDCHILDHITPHHIRGYFVYLKDEKEWKSASVQSAARAIRAFTNFCVAEDMLKSSPMTRVKTPKSTEHILPAYSKKNVRALLDAATNRRDVAMILCLLDSGCRASEFLAWNVEDVQPTSGTVRLRRTKNRRERTVYLGIRARKERIKVYASQGTAPSDPIWRTLDTGARLRYNGLKTLFQRLGKAAGVTPCNPHRFRRTFALWSLRNGMNVYALQRIMGHSDLSVLRRYLALLDSDLQDAHQRYGAVDNGLE